MKDTILQGNEIYQVFSQGQTKNKVLNNIDVEIYEKDFTMIMGPSGAGKSTLMYVLSGMDRATGGTVIFKGNPLHRLSEKEMADIRAKEFGFVFQQSYLVSNLTVMENVLAAGYAGSGKKNDSVCERTEILLKEMGIWEARNRLPSEISGGEAQRAAVARAVVNHPTIVWCDEPTGQLNKSNTEEVLNLFSHLNRKGQSILMVTHDLRAAIRGNRILYLEDGKLTDELTLSPYRKGEERQRENKISKWLSQMRW